MINKTSQNCIPKMRCNNPQVINEDQRCQRGGGNIFTKSRHTADTRTDTGTGTGTDTRTTRTTRTRPSAGPKKKPRYRSSRLDMQFCSQEADERTRCGLMGFKNRSVFCYAIAVLQALAHCPGVPSFLFAYKANEEEDEDEDGKSSNTAIMEVLKDVFRAKWSTRHVQSMVLPSVLERLLFNRSSISRSPSQEDASEYLSSLIEHTSMSSFFTHTRGYVDECALCGSTTQDTHKTTDIFRLYLGTETTIDLQQAINSLFQTEDIDKYCTECKHTLLHFRRPTLHTSPDILCVQIIRTGADLKKITKKVSIMKFVSLPLEDTSRADPLYKLRAVVCHAGYSAQSGHYTAICRIPSSIYRGRNNWVNFNDEQVNRVLPPYKDFTQGAGDPYLLFYTPLRFNKQ